ncbi:MAG: class I SAM-dependent methyltransferase [Vicinamibacterales bacterium]
MSTNEPLLRPITDRGSRTADRGSQIADRGPRALDRRPRTTDSEPRSADRGSPIADRGNDALPEGIWVNAGSGPSSPAGWMSIDGSWQAWLASHGVAASVARLLTGRDTGHWPRGIVCRDVRRGLGLAPGSAAVVFSSHLIEHLHRSEALALLRDAHRVLRPGGVCRVVTPDLGCLVDAYVIARPREAGAADRLQDALLLHPVEPPRAGALLGWYRRATAFDQHKWVYDGDSLCALLREAGFSAPAVRGFLESDIPADRLAQVEHRERVCDGAGICVEARR